MGTHILSGLAAVLRPAQNQPCIHYSLPPIMMKDGKSSVIFQKEAGRADMTVQ